MKLYPFLAFVFLFIACNNKKEHKATIEQVFKKQGEKKQGELHLDTLQFIHFEGNFDYWYGVFINSHKDTVQLIVDDVIPPKLKNSLVKVQWFTDTLFEAGDNDSKYAAKRLKSIHQIDGVLFEAPVTEEKVINDVKNLPEVKANADQTGIAERPNDEKEYFLVETGTHGEDNFSRLFMFRVYVYPKYEIRFYDAAGDTDISLAEWRSKKQ